MSTDQPPPPPPDDSDPFRKQPPPSPGEPWGAPGEPVGEPYGGRPGGGAEPLAGMPPLAHLGRRLLARIIDALIIGIPVGLIMTLAVGGYDPTDSDDTNKATGFTVAYALVYFVYEGWMLSTSGQTIGKKIMKIRVALLQNGAIPVGQPGWLRAAVFSLPEVVPCCGVVFWLLNVLWCTWDRPYRQCIHDKAARTVVVSAVP